MQNQLQEWAGIGWEIFYKNEIKTAESLCYLSSDWPGIRFQDL